VRIEHVTSVKAGHLGCDNILFKRWVQEPAALVHRVEACKMCTA